jgi:hypothetical protein
MTPEFLVFRPVSAWEGASGVSETDAARTFVPVGGLGCTILPPEGPKQASKLRRQARTQIGNFEFLVSGPISDREKNLGSVRDGRSTNTGARGVVSDVNPSPKGREASKQASGQAKKSSKNQGKKFQILGFRTSFGAGEGPRECQKRTRREHWCPWGGLGCTILLPGGPKQASRQAGKQAGCPKSPAGT